MLFNISVQDDAIFLQEPSSNCIPDNTLKTQPEANYENNVHI